jgi:hypothetical protein
MPQIARGVSRTVLLVGRWAVKIPSLRTNGQGVFGVAWSFSRGLQANLSERTWSGVDGVCPVLWSLAGLVNIYPRCQSVDAFDGDYGSIGAPFLPAGDRKPQNLGLLDGRIVWIDYDGSWNGCPHARSAHDLRDDETVDAD